MNAAKCPIIAKEKTMVDRNLLLTVARVLRRQLDDDSDPMSLAYVVARNADKAALDAALARVDRGEAG
jgi:hypothetical protein